jgi:alkanesulfonate monooxygenase SsuD/methylene tetrahydromethanopterin reductase-like flavin-dependent oxidoreductase (luciferase family)
LPWTRSTFDRPLQTFDSQAMQGPVKGVIESAPDKSFTFRDLIRSRLACQCLTGAPEQIADALQACHDAGVDRFNLVPLQG